MSSFGVKLGVGIGIISAPLIMVGTFDLLLGRCYFEQGCGQYEGLKMLGAILTGLAGGACVAFVAARIFKSVANRASK